MCFGKSVGTAFNFLVMPVLFCLCEHSMLFLVREPMLISSSGIRRKSTSSVLKSHRLRWLHLDSSAFSLLFMSLLALPCCLSSLVNSLSLPRPFRQASCHLSALLPPRGQRRLCCREHLFCSPSSHLHTPGHFPFPEPVFNNLLVGFPNIPSILLKLLISVTYNCLFTACLSTHLSIWTYKTSFLMLKGMQRWFWPQPSRNLQSSERERTSGLSHLLGFWTPSSPICNCYSQ